MQGKLTPLHRLYLREHPLALWFSVGAIITGLPILLAPFLAEGSAALAVLPDWAVFVWASWYTLGGTLSVAGMVRLTPRLEAAGMAFLASALAVTIVTAFVARGVGALLSGAFLITLVIGCASRAYFLGWTK